MIAWAECLLRGTVGLRMFILFFSPSPFLPDHLGPPRGSHFTTSIYLEAGLILADVCFFPTCLGR